MAIGSLIALLVASLAASGIAAGVSAANNAKNIDAQKEANKQNIDFTRETNEQNIAFQREINAQNQYNIEHAHQIEMADLQAAGLNPILTASGGSGAPIQRLDAATAKAPQVDAIKSDMSGVSAAIQGFGNTIQSLMMFSLMSDMRKELQMSHNDTLMAMSGNRDRVLSQLYRRKAEAYNGTNTAETINRAVKKSEKIDMRQYEAIFKRLGL